MDLASAPSSIQAPCRFLAICSWPRCHTTRRELVTRAPVSIVILTLNEALNIADCIASCDGCDDVHVLDSGSSDGTGDIARRCEAQVHVHPFTSFAAQRNWAIDHIATKYDWIFHLDADERLTPELIAAMSRRLASAPEDAGFYVPEKFMFMGRWLKRTAGYPKYQMRLFHKGRMRFRDYGHGQRELTAGVVGVLEQPYLHFPFSKGVDDWLERHDRYSSDEARQMFGGQRDAWSIAALAARDRVRRRRAWKECGYRAPFRPFARWFVTLFVLGGILEGRAARTYARLIATYEEMTTQKLRALRAGTADATPGRRR
jgi:glycosyltransferase involved in cell wall biosynthesis